MSDGFLSRWSRLKRRTEAVPAEAPDPGPEPDTGAAEARLPADPASAPEAEAEAEAEAEVSPEEIAALPAPEALTPDSDITGFLRKGVPPALRNAALRRMWTLDPAIRDFVGDARDYAWDWNVPGGVPVSGPLSASTDVGAMLRQIVGGGDQPPAAPDDRGLSPRREPASPSCEVAASEPTLPDPTEPMAGTDAPDPPEPEETPPAPLPAGRKRHGGALPG